jgi:hypothetical protein
VSSNSTLVTRFSLFAVLFALTACDPEVHVHGRVMSSDGPIRPAEIRVECPDLCAFAVVDDDNGSYSSFKMGGCPLSCGLRIRSSGYDDFVSPVAKFCAEQSRGMCWDIAASVVLQAPSPRAR